MNTELFLDYPLNINGLNLYYIVVNGNLYFRVQNIVYLLGLKSLNKKIREDPNVNIKNVKDLLKIEPNIIFSELVTNNTQYITENSFYYIMHKTDTIQSVKCKEWYSTYVVNGYDIIKQKFQENINFLYNFIQQHNNICSSR